MLWALQRCHLAIVAREQMSSLTHAMIVSEHTWICHVYDLCDILVSVSITVTWFWSWIGTITDTHGTADDDDDDDSWKLIKLILSPHIACD